MSEVTLRQIAVATGASLTTVSFALRDSPKVSAAKREMIKETARRLGYRPNPLVTAAMSRMRAARPTNYQSTLGWVNDHPDPQRWRNDPVYLGAARRARELGYVLDEFYLDEIRNDEPSANVRRFCQIARARGIHGLLLPELWRSHHAAEEWPDLAVVVIGRVCGDLRRSTVRGASMYCPLHSVTSDHFFNMRLAFDALRERGYGRIGLVISNWLNDHNDNQTRAAFVEFSQNIPAANRIAPLLLDHVLTRQPPPVFGRWLEKWRPDVILCANWQVREWVEHLTRRNDLEIGMAHIGLGATEKEWSGIDPRNEMIGASALDILAAHLQRNERGTPPYPKQVNVPGIWVDGSTTRGLAAGK